jgi:hypothetical protein
MKKIIMIVNIFIVSVLFLGCSSPSPKVNIDVNNITARQMKVLMRETYLVNKFFYGEMRIKNISLDDIDNKKYLSIQEKIDVSFNSERYTLSTLGKFIYEHYVLSIMSNLKHLNSVFISNIYGYRIYSLVDLHSFIEQDSNSIVLSVKKILGYKIGDNIEYEFYLSKKDVEEYMNNKITDKQLANRITILENGHRISIF